MHGKNKRIAPGSGRCIHADQRASHAVTWEHDLLNVQVLSPNPQTVVFKGNFNVPASNIALFGGDTFAFSIGTTSVTFEYKGNAAFAFQNSTIVR